MVVFFTSSVLQPVSFYLQHIATLLQGGDGESAVCRKHTAEVRDLHVEGEGVGVAGVAPHTLEDEVTLHDVSKILSKKEQDITLPHGEVLAVAVILDSGEGGGETGVAEEKGKRLWRVRPFFYPRYYFFWIERFGNIIVAFQVETSKAVGFLSSVGEKEDKYARVHLADAACQLEAVHHRHIDIQQDQVKCTIGRYTIYELLPPRLPILGVRHFIALHFQKLLQEKGILAVIINKKDSHIAYCLGGFEW